LSDRAGHPVTLENVPPSQFATWESLGFTHVWAMGVWTTGARARALARAQSSLRQLCAESFPNWTESDIDSSPYAIADYAVAQSLGGESGLREFRRRLREHGLGLLLDFVPNHLGLDHPWLASRPELFVQSAREMPESFPIHTAAGLRWLAYGKDPYFPAWRDTVQLDYRAAQTRAAMIDTLQSAAARCDGVRCDMAMLLLHDIFEKTWEPFPGAFSAPGSQFWSEAIDSVKKGRPQFLFLAEAYWNLESRLQRLGFDYVYDKPFYDHLVRRELPALRRHLRDAGSALAAARFLENHDEARIASLLNTAEQKPAALLLLGQPGLRLLNHGQLTGKSRLTPVQLTRYLPEAPNPEITGFYEKILLTVAQTDVGRGDSTLLEARTVRPPQTEADNVFLIHWQAQAGGFCLIAVNMASQSARIWAKIAALEHGSWTVRDLLDLNDPPLAAGWAGARLEIELPPHGLRLLEFANLESLSQTRPVRGPGLHNRLIPAVAF
jgi:hypothetical protein